jgi:hypothetical protein
MNRVLLLFAVLVGLAIAYVDSRPGWVEAGETAFVLLVSAAVLGFVGPQRPWLWALAIGIWIPLHTLMRTPHSIGSPAMFVVLAFAFAGAYAGMALRGVLAAGPSSGRGRQARVLVLQDKTTRGYRMPQLSEPEARAQLVPLLERFAPEMGGPPGTLESLTLLEESTDAGRCLRRYRAVSGNGVAFICTVVEAPDRRRRRISLERAPE